MANEFYRVRGTGIVWTDSGGDEVLDVGALAADAVRVGAYHDWGASPQPDEYMVEIKIDGFDTAPVIGETVDTYISEGQTTSFFTGPESPADTADGAGNTDRLPNLKGPYLARVWSTTAGDNIVISFWYTSAARYHAPVIHNNTADALLGTADAHTVTIYPIYYQLQ